MGKDNPDEILGEEIQHLISCDSEFDKSWRPGEIEELK
jgi:hypothetical protein